MKKKAFWQVIIVFGLIISFLTISIVYAAPLEIDDSFESTIRSEWKFTDRHGTDYSEELTANQKMIVTGVNSTWVNYTQIFRQDYYWVTVDVGNGGWTSSKVDGEIISTYERQFNRTIDPSRQYMDFSWMDYPTWNNNTAGTEFREWNQSNHYNERFNYFDMEDDESLDEFNFEIYPHTFVNDPEEFVNIIETQWNVLANGNVDDLPKKLWNRTDQSWFIFDNELFDHVAYSARVVSNDSYGNAEIIEFTPEWVGDYWYPNNFQKWNGSEWVPRVDIETDVAYGSNPIEYIWNGTAWVEFLKEDYYFFAQSYLNQRRTGFNETFTNIKESFTEDSFSFQFDVEFEDLERLTFHDPVQWSEERRNDGTLSLIYEYSYHKDKMYIQTEKISRAYDFGDNGKYSFLRTTRPAGAAGIPGFDFPVLLFSIASMVLILKRKRLK